MSLVVNTWLHMSFGARRPRAGFDARLSRAIDLPCLLNVVLSSTGRSRYSSLLESIREHRGHPHCQCWGALGAGIGRSNEEVQAGCKEGGGHLQ
jgi:hypothetical protein